MQHYPNHVEIVEVGPRDGFQSISQFIPTSLKQKILTRLYQSGCRSMEITSFVSPKAIPQMQDATEVSRFAIEQFPDARLIGLCPNMRGVATAYEAGLRNITYVISVSEGHNQKNVRRSREESFSELLEIRKAYPDLSINLGAATAFGCPFDGAVALSEVLSHVELAAKAGVNSVELCDTIGVANPRQVEETCRAVIQRFPELCVGIHIHDTRNTGIANSLVAVQSGVSRVSTTVGGLGGCPFAPGASGNTSTEDFVRMLNAMGIQSGIDFEKLLATARYLREQVPGNYSGHCINVQESACC